MEEAKLSQKFLGAVRSAWHVALVFGVLYLFVDFAGTFLKPIFNVKEYTLRIPMLDDDHISAKFYVLEGIDFTKISSITVSLKADSRAFFMISDYNARYFQCARVSTFKHLPSGILRYIDGKPQDFVRIQPVKPLTYQVDFGSEQGKLPKPKQSLYLMAYPPWKYPKAAVSNLTIKFENGSMLNVELTDSIPKLWSFVLALLLLPLLLLFDKRQTSHIPGEKLKYIKKLVGINRLLGGLIIAFARSHNLSEGSVYGSIGYYFVSLSIIVFFLWIFFGVYVFKRTRLAYERKSLLRLPFALVSISVLLLPILLAGTMRIVEIRKQQKDFVDNLKFRGKQLKNVDGQKIVLCMGGSSTLGSPFGSNWPYDYPSHLEDILKQKFPSVLVLNGGVGSTSTFFAYETLPKIMDKAKIDVVTLNFLCNDSVLFLIRSISEKILFFLPKKWMRPTNEARYRKLLVDTVNIVRKRGAVCVFVLETTFNYVYFGVDPFHKTRPIVKEVAREMGVPLVDPNPVFAQNRDRFLFIDDVHLSKFGTELLARVLSEELFKILEEQSRLDE